MGPPDTRQGEALSVANSLGGETTEGFKRQDLGARLKRYATARENALLFRDFLLSVDEHQLADALGSCGNYATFREYFTVGQIRLSKFCTCQKHLLCPLCAIRRGAKALRVYLAKVELLMASDALLRPYLVTFTVKNGSDLVERSNHLLQSLRAYHKRRKGTRQHGEVRKASAAVWSYEVKRGKNSGQWHMHPHAIWLCREAPDAFKLSAEWHEVTGDSMIVDVRPIDMTDPVGGFCEVFKYALKFSDLADLDRLHVYRTLKGKRLQDSFGDLRGLKVEPTNQDDLLEELPYIERFFAYKRGTGYELVHTATVTPSSEDDRRLAALIDMGWSDDQILAFMESLEDAA